MEDSERLTLAAKAVSYQVCEPYRDGEFRVCLPGDNSSFQWNPLTDDGDALRLAVSLNMGISIPFLRKPRADVVCFLTSQAHSIVEHPTDTNFAVRNAIVNVAVQLAQLTLSGTTRSRQQGN